MTIRMKHVLAPAAMVALGALSFGCDTTDVAPLAVTTWGEEFIEQGIGAEEFADGWSVRFEHFLVNVGDVHVGDGVAEPVRLEGRLLDLVVPGEKTIGTLSLETKPWAEVGYSLRKVASAGAVEPGVRAEDRERMAREGWSVLVVGEGRKGEVSKRFSWGFATEVDYRGCRTEVDGKEQLGVLLASDRDNRVQLTIHGDHLFYDDLASPEAQLRFANMAAADANDDGEITMQELDAVLREDLAGASYSVGGAADIFTYGDFVRALTRSLGHYQGEGHCEQASR